jgi:hypothetical protein
MEEIKDLVQRFYDAQKASTEVISLRKQLVVALKSRGLTDTKFNFGDRTIQYSSVAEPEGITQKLIKDMVTREYPQIDPEVFMKKLKAARKTKVAETIKVVHKREAK